MPSVLSNLTSPQPLFLEVDAVRVAKTCFDLFGSATSIGGERDQNFLLNARTGNYLVKVANPAEPDELLEFQNAALRHIHTQNPRLPVPPLIKTSDGKDWVVAKGSDDRPYRVRVFGYLPGMNLREAPHDICLMQNLGQILGRLDLALRGFFHSAADHSLEWDLKRLNQLVYLTSNIEDPSEKALVEPVFEAFLKHVYPQLLGLRAQVIHNDVSFHNIVVDSKEPSAISGIFDFGDLIHAPLIQELAVTASEVAAIRDDPIANCTEIVSGYNAVIPLEPIEFELLPHLVCARLALGITIDHWIDANISWDDEREHLVGWHQRSVTALRKFAKMGSTEMTEILRQKCGVYGKSNKRLGSSTPNSSRSPWDRRLRTLGNAAVVAYDQPLHLVRGEGVWLYDYDGRKYLDVYNNVPHVGHCHPHVVAAVAEQTATLNTNTRYVYDSILDYAERLTATLPHGLDVCYFVSSGSEANDLAWRIAKAVTRNAGAIVVENAYHGMTDAVFELSPSEWPRSWHQDPNVCSHIAMLPAPDDYRGRWRRDITDRGERYAALCDVAIGTLKSKGYAPAVFFMDMILSSNGIFSPPPGYLQGVFRRVRAAGGLCVADEVQSGFGRIGKHMWGFELDNVVPDIVTFGKPIANGYPMGLVVTTRAIADCFEQHSEFFSTTGGNPVACAAASAVLDVIEGQELVDHAHHLGAKLMDDIRDLEDAMTLLVTCVAVVCLSVWN